MTARRDAWLTALEGLVLKRSGYLEEVRDEARLEMRRQDTIDFLEARFPSAVPAEVVTRVKSETDLAKLGRWVKLAGTASSPAAFLAGME